jgi:hypothetical protein
MCHPEASPSKGSVNGSRWRRCSRLDYYPGKSPIGIANEDHSQSESADARGQGPCPTSAFAAEASNPGSDEDHSNSISSPKLCFSACSAA